MPTKAQELWSMLGLEGAVAEQTWPGVPERGNWRGTVEARSKLGEVGALFAKIDDETVRAEIASLEARAGN